MSIHRLDTSVGAKELVDFPSEFCVNLVTQSNVRDFGHGDDTRDNFGEHIDRDVREPWCLSWNETIDFTNLDDRVHQKDGVEDAVVVICERELRDGRAIDDSSYARAINCRVFRAYTASRAIANWKTLCA